MAVGYKEAQVERELREETPDLEDLVGYNLKRAYVIIRNDFLRAIGRDGFTPRNFSALSLVVQFPNITQSELARMLGIERSGLVAIVDDLEKRCLLHRTVVPGDRRVQALVPTKKGTKTYAEMRSAVREHEETLLADLTENERGTLIALLRKIRKSDD